MRICIDPGHGGVMNRGTTVDGFDEADWVLRFAVRLSLTLGALGIDTEQTRLIDEHVPWAERRERAGGCDLVVSLHVNSSEDPHAHGAQAYYWPGNARTCALARKWIEAVPDALFSRVYTNMISADRARGEWIEAPRTVLGAYPQDALLLELFFASSARDREAIERDEVYSHLLAATAYTIAGAYE